MTCRCRKRMRRFFQDKDGDGYRVRQFFLCPACGRRFTFTPSLNAGGEEWPPAIFEMAVREGVLSAEGKVLARG